MYKNLGLSSEQVCEIGQWKNSTAFQAHYLRLGARTTAAEEIQRLVHIVSPRSEAEPERSRTPPSNYYEVGGIDLEGEAQDRGETYSLKSGGVVCFLGCRSRRFPLLLFVPAVGG